MPGLGVAAGVKQPLQRQLQLGPQVPGRYNAISSHIIYISTSRCLHPPVVVALPLLEQVALEPVGAPAAEGGEGGGLLQRVERPGVHQVR